MVGENKLQLGSRRKSKSWNSRHKNDEQNIMSCFLPNLTDEGEEDGLKWVREYYGTSTKVREYDFHHVLQGKGVFLTTYLNFSAGFAICQRLWRRRPLWAIKEKMMHFSITIGYGIFSLSVLYDTSFTVEALPESANILGTEDMIQNHFKQHIGVFV